MKSMISEENQINAICNITKELMHLTTFDEKYAALAHVYRICGELLLFYYSNSTLSYIRKRTHKKSNA